MLIHYASQNFIYTNDGFMEGLKIKKRFDF